ncbi:MAG: S8 family serine peptidase [Bacteroidetes bacterium]|nr:S8 family serine peptidase [Bacteroidota bacterium]
MVRVFSCVLLYLLPLLVNGQSSVYNYYYRIYFKDKGNVSPDDFLPGQLFSERAIERRQKAGIDILDYSDLPVFQEYLTEVSSKGLTLHCTSRWMNTALFKSRTPINAAILLQLPFVYALKPVKVPGKKDSGSDKLNFAQDASSAATFDQPVIMLNGYALHNQGFYGKGILIAVLDGGFDNAEEISSLADLRNRNGIKATHDFVKNTEFVYNSSTHGTAVLSVLSGRLPFIIEGTAPEADYLLLKTEDVDSEFPCEEDYWASGAEYADSAGADIISSSLGYSTFDDPSMNYKYSDLNGNKAFVTLAADIAASKGILVFNSAGNERNKSWGKIICPADGDSVIAVGAVDSNNRIADFSSAGPTYDTQIKPDNAAMGVAVPVQTTISTTGRANGTSFSCPVLSGMTACLMQALPKAKNNDIIKALRESSDRFYAPDSLYGYGIPDMGAALLRLQDMFILKPVELSVALPNPTTGEFEIIFREPYESIVLEIFSVSGKIICKKEINTFAGRLMKIDELVNREQGLYIIRITTPTAKIVHKVIKLRN